MSIRDARRDKCEVCHTTPASLSQLSPGPPRWCLECYKKDKALHGVHCTRFDSGAYIAKQDTARTNLAHTKRTIDTMRRKNDGMTVAAAKLKDRVKQLEAALTAAGVAVPPAAKRPRVSEPAASANEVAAAAAAAARPPTKRTKRARSGCDAASATA